MDNTNDGFEEIFTAIVLNSTGWHRHENSETGDVAFFAITEPDVDKWETAALAMHKSQERVSLAAKPLNSRARRTQVYRAD